MIPTIHAVAQQANPGEPPVLLGFVYSACAVSAEEDTQTFSINIDSCLMISIHQVVAVRTLVLTVAERQLLVNVAAFGAFLTGWKPPVNFDKVATLSFGLISKHPRKVTPSIIAG